MNARVFTVAPGTPFVDAVAAGLRAQAGDEPLALADAIVLLPTRRACRSLREAFLRVSDGAALLLPAMRPLGEVEADSLALSDADGDWEGEAEAALQVPPAVSPVRRRMLLAELVLRTAQAGGSEMQPDQALFLAGELARLLDQMQTEETPFSALRDIAPEPLAAHWQETLEFLGIVTEHWPAVLAELGVIDPAERRRRLMDAQAERWRRTPPAHPVVAAGSTGSIPATARLLAVVAASPRGAVVLPGLDRNLSDEAWQALEPTHPQYAMRNLLQGIGVPRAAVADWTAPGVRVPHPARARLLAMALRPAMTWNESGGVEHDAVAGLHRMDLPGPEEEARAVALVLREALETPGRTTALATPDRGLARRVAAELSQWSVEADDSGGVPLALTRVGAFLRLTAEAVAEEAAPVPLLAALKHPLAAGGVPPGRFRFRVRQLEELVLRGPRPASGFAGLRQAVAAHAVDGDPAATRARVALAWLDPLAAAAEPLVQAMARPRAALPALLTAHIALAEALSGDGARPGARRLWAGDDGEAAALWMNEVLHAAPSAPPFNGAHYPAVLTELMDGVVVRPRGPRHPRVHIWGLLEARLQQADVLVLGGLNEGVWPPEVGADPWFSRPMRTAAGLPLPERRVGLSAHDFAQAAAAPRAVLSRATKVAGESTVPSRWLVRLEAVLQGAGLRLSPAPWAEWQAALHDPDRMDAPTPPAPRPPLAARPRQLSATRIEALAADPYAVYARHVLRLSKADDLDADPDAADRGRFIHQAIDAFLRNVGESLPPDALDALLRHGERAFGRALDRPNVFTFWWPRFRRTAAWFVRHERARRAHTALVGSEVSGERTWEAPGGPFTLTAQADRIDRFREGGLAIVDYKTGTLPQKQEILFGFKPQLALEAVLAEAGGFPDIAAEPVRELAFWKLDGRSDGGLAYTPHGLDVARVVAEAREGVRRLVAAFDDPAMPYLSRPRPESGPRFSDYDHLARVQEWSAGARIEDGR